LDSRQIITIETPHQPLMEVMELGEPCTHVCNNYL